jgi:hypothetical protein
VSLFLGLRYATAAARSGGLAEKALAAVLLLSGVVGIGANTAYGLGLRTTAAGPALLAVTLVAGNFGAAIAGFFGWRVFRPTSSAARAVAIALAVLLGLSVAAHVVVDGFVLGASSIPLLLTGVALRASAFGWTSIESFLQFHRLRKQLKVGLGDPVVCNRFLLFGIATAAIVLASAGGSAGFWSGLCRLVTALALIPACAPSQAYLKRVRRDHARAA